MRTPWLTVNAKSQPYLTERVQLINLFRKSNHITLCHLDGVCKVYEIKTPNSTNNFLEKQTFTPDGNNLLKGSKLRLGPLNQPFCYLQLQQVFDSWEWFYHG